MKEESQNLFSARRVSLIRYSGQSIHSSTGWKIKLNGTETGLSIDQSTFEGLKNSKKDKALFSQSLYLQLTIKNITRALVKYGVKLTEPEKDNLKTTILSLI